MCVADEIFEKIKGCSTQRLKWLMIPVINN